MDTFDNLTKYKIFLSAAENKSISKAAASLYISQPAGSIADGERKAAVRLCEKSVSNAFGYGKKS